MTLFTYLTQRVAKGLGLKFLTWAGSIFCCSGWVRKAIFVLGLEISPKNLKIFNFSLRIIESKTTQLKDGSVSHLLRVKSMLGLGWVGLGPFRAHLYQRVIGALDSFHFSLPAHFYLPIYLFT